MRMKLRYYQYYNGECVINVNGRIAINIKTLVEALSIDEKLLKQILQKYGARFHHPQSSLLDFYFESSYTCERFLESPELEPYVVMLELSS